MRGMSKHIRTIALMTVLVAGGMGGGWLWAGSMPSPQHHTIKVTARKYAFEPSVIRVNRGDRITLKFRSKDVTHGFFLEGYDLDARIVAENPNFLMRHPSLDDDYQWVDHIEFIADKEGKFYYRCSVTCGPLHPFMQGELIVGPNRLVSTSIGLTIGLVLATLVYLARKDEPDGEER